MKYKEMKLGDVAEINMGQSPNSKYFNSDGKGIEFLQGIRTFGENYPSFDTYTTQYNKISEKGDILFSVRAPVGKINWSDRKIAIGRGLAALKVLPNFSSKYVYYFLKKIGSQINSISSGTVFSSINKKELANVKILIPDSLKDQEYIGTRLALLDKKIELNNRINDNLDSLLTTIFHKEVNNTNFSKANLTDIANYRNGLAMQKYRPKSNEKSLPVLKIKELNQGFTDSSSDRCSSEINEDFIVKTGDIIFSWSGTLLVKNWSGTIAGLNQHLFKVTSKKYPNWFIYEWTKYHLNKFQTIASGKATTMGHIKRSDLKESRVYIPSERKLNKLNTLMKPIYDKRIEIIRENQQLTYIKQILLQKYF